jgi:hypothetical protein
MLSSLINKGLTWAILRQNTEFQMKKVHNFLQSYKILANFYSKEYEVFRICKFRNSFKTFTEKLSKKYKKSTKLRLGMGSRVSAQIFAN